MFQSREEYSPKILKPISTSKSENAMETNHFIFSLSIDSVSKKLGLLLKNWRKFPLESGKRDVKLFGSVSHRKS